MYFLSEPAQNSRWTIPTDVLTYGCVRNRECSMRAEAIGVARLSLRSQQPLSPLEQMELRIFIEPTEAPIFALARAEYVEKTWAGYWIDAMFCTISNSDKERLAQFLIKGKDGCADASTSPVRCRGQRSKLMTLGVSFPPAVRNVLQARGFTIHHASNMKQAMSLLSQGQDILVTDNSIPSVSITDLCQKLNTCKGAPDLLCLVEYATDQEVEEFLSAGAARIVWKPSSYKTLVERIMTTLAERTELQTAAYSSATTLSSRDWYGSAKSMSQARKKSFWSNLRNHLRGFFAQPHPAAAS